MAELAKKLHFKKNGTEQTAKAYSTTAEAGTEYITNKIDGVTCYVAIGDTTDNRATVGRVKKSSTAAERAILSTGKPPYTEQSWTTAGTYTFTVPAGVTRIRVAVCGGGGGAAYCADTDGDRRSYTGGTGGTSSFGSLISATGGTGGTFSMWCIHSGSSEDQQADTYAFDGTGGNGGFPNGNNGNFVSRNNCYKNNILTSSGGYGFLLNFEKISTNGGYGNGGYAVTQGADPWGYPAIANAAGGSGGYNSNYFNVIAGNTYSITVGGAGSNGAGNMEGGAKATPTNAKSGFAFIAFGGDI